MTSDRHDFLDKLAQAPPNTFEAKFLKDVFRVGLEADLNSTECFLLYRAAFCAKLCNIAFNGLGGCKGKISPQKECNRVWLEREFMIARERFCDTVGWHQLPKPTQGLIQTIFLNVFVASDNLAW